MNCLFCRVVDRSIDVDVLHETEQLIAFRDIAPQAPQHFLVIPKQHIIPINDITLQNQAILGELFMAAQHLAKTHGFAEAGYRTVINCNADGGQTVFHLHLHILGGRVCQWPPG